MNVDREMKTGKRVQLAFFKGVKRPLVAVPSDEDYWKLIGSKGTVQDLAPNEPTHMFFGKALVVFDEDPSILGLACHNPIPKSLWIAISDLE